MTQDFHLSPTAQGLVLSAFSWTYAVMQLPSGWLIDKFGIRVMYGAAVLLWSVFTGLTALAGNFAALLGFRLGLGVGESGTYPSSVKAISQWFPRRERGRATAFYDSGARAGSALAVPVITAIIAAFSWHAAFLITAGAGVLWTIGWWAYYRSPGSHRGTNEQGLAMLDERDEDDPGSAGPNKRRARELLRHRTVWGVIAGFVRLNFVVTFFLTWFPTYLVKGRGFDLLKLGFFGMIPAWQRWSAVGRPGSPVTGCSSVAGA
jgi:ACS family D-galactonate transporter-like MFS transporter